MERPNENEVPTLHVVGDTRRGKLYYVLSGQPVLTVDLPPAWVCMLLVLRDAWRADANRLEDLRGWRRPPEIAEMYLVYTGDYLPVKPHAISQSFSKMKKEILRVAAACGVAPSLVSLPWEYDRKLGRRLPPWRLRFIDYP
jgi:hypothetical protein